jgi:hypothetical protein
MRALSLSFTLASIHSEMKTESLQMYTSADMYLTRSELQRLKTTLKVPIYSGKEGLQAANGSGRGLKEKRVGLCKSYIDTREWMRGVEWRDM